MSAPDPHTLTGAYSVHALPETERAEFERHLTVCESCAQEVRELTATAERLGLAATLTPPPAMKQRVLEGIATVRQEPPRVSRHRRRDEGGGGPVFRVRRLPRLALAATLAAAAALGGVAVWQYETAQDARQRAERAEQRGETLARVMAAPDAKASSGDLPGGAKGTVVVSRSEDRAAVFTAGLPEPPPGKVYQLWFDDGGTMRPAGLLDPGGSGDVVLMDGPVARASGMGITVEPAGGSPQPTSDPVARMKFPA